MLGGTWCLEVLTNTTDDSKEVLLETTGDSDAQAKGVISIYEVLGHTADWNIVLETSTTKQGIHSAPCPVTGYTFQTSYHHAGLQQPASIVPEQQLPLF